MKNISNPKAELKKSAAYKKTLYLNHIPSKYLQYFIMNYQARLIVVTQVSTRVSQVFLFKNQKHPSECSVNVGALKIFGNVT